MKHYVYVITNKLNGMQYVGDHSTENINEDKYLGSGKLLNEDKKKYGKNNFEKKIIEFFDTKKEAFDAQEKWIKHLKTHISQGGYNISWKGGLCVKDAYQFTKEDRKKMSEAHKGKVLSEETKERMSNSAMGHKKWEGKEHSEETKKKMSEAHKGKVLSEETKKKMSEAAKGRKLSLETRMKMSAAKKGVKKKKKIIEEFPKEKLIHGNTGKKLSNEHRKKISESKKGQVSPNKGKTFSEETRRKMSEAHKKKI